MVLQMNKHTIANNRNQSSHRGLDQVWDGGDRRRWRQVAMQVVVMVVLAGRARSLRQHAPRKSRSASRRRSTLERWRCGCVFVGAVVGARLESRCRRRGRW